MWVLVLPTRYYTGNRQYLPIPLSFGSHHDTHCGVPRPTTRRNTQISQWARWKVSDQIRDDVARKSICQHSFPDQQDRFLIFTSWNSQARGPGCGWVPWVLGNYLETIWKLFGNHLVKDASWTSVGKPFALLHGDYSNPIQRRLCWEKSKERAHRPDFPDLASLPWGRLWGQLQQAQVHRRCSLLCRERQHCGEICTVEDSPKTVVTAFWFTNVIFPPVCWSEPDVGPSPLPHLGRESLLHRRHRRKRSFARF